MSIFPAAFLETMQQQLGCEYSAFLNALHQISPISLRLNPQKPSERFADNPPVPWCAQGRYLAERPVFTIDPIFHAGGYYVQEASSMYLSAIMSHFDMTNKPLRILDLCAAPGGKSTLLAAEMSKDSFLLANEVIKQRSHILAENLVKWGASNTFASCNDVKDMALLHGFFDMVLIDAPCSGEGMFRKDSAAINEWSPAHVRLCAARQRRILADALPLLAPAGLLVYCTCTFNPQENEEQIEWLDREMGWQPLSLPHETAWAIEKGHFYPHRLSGEGFFVQCMKRHSDKHSDKLPQKNKDLHRAGKNNATYNEIARKKLPDIGYWLAKPDNFVFVEDRGECYAIPADNYEAWVKIKQALYLNKQGLHLGKWAKNGLIPSPELALSTDIAAAVPDCSLTLPQALDFLRRQTSLPPENLPKGWQTVSFEGLRLGWIKVVDDRINNYYPQEWRIKYL